MWSSPTRAQAAVKPGHAAECGERRKRLTYPGGRLVPAALEAYGRCGECPHLGLCAVCPLSTGHIPDNDDPDLIPAFQCAFNRVALDHRARFLGIDPQAVPTWFADLEARDHELREAMDFAAEALSRIRKASSPPQ